MYHPSRWVKNSANWLIKQTMKNYIIAAVMLGGVGMLYFALEGTKSVEYEAPATEIVVETVEVDATAARIKAAQDEQLERINSEADKMRQSFVDNEMLKIEAEVLKEMEAELKARRTDAEKKTGAY